MKFLIFSLVCVTSLTHSHCLRLRGEAYPGVKNRNTEIPFKKVYQKPESRIAGGEIAAIAFAPWQVSVQNQYGNHFCGGAIIGDQHVLTAASCVAGLDKRKIKVITGTNNWMAAGVAYYAKEIIIHCNFDRPLYHNDVALIKLNTSFAYDDKTQNITLVELDELEVGETLTMTGWGSGEVGQDYAEELKKLDAILISNEQCKDKYGRHANDVDDGHLCVMPPTGSGACHGDTGGPLVNSKGQLVGLGNWGVPCAKGFPDVFVKVSFYNDFIRTTIKGCYLTNSQKY